MSRVVIVPGLAVRSYAEPAASALARIHEVELAPAPTWRGVPDDIRTYGQWLAGTVRTSGRPVDLMVGLSLGTQAAAVAAAGCDVARLLLVSPTVEPAKRTVPALLGSWLRGDHHPDSEPVWRQVPDWAHASPRRILHGIVSALRVPLEGVLGEVSAELTIVHAGWDNLTSYGYGAALAAEFGGQVIERPAAPHSWPIGDTDGFLELVDRLLQNTSTT